MCIHLQCAELISSVDFWWWRFRPGNGSPSATNVVPVLVVSTKAFLFHNRSLSDFAYTLLTMFSRIAPCRIFKLRPN